MYTNKNLEYPLTEYEYNNIDNVFKFIKRFRFIKYNLKSYRSGIIKIIRKKYTLNEFMEYEKIAEKLFWNIRYKTYKFFDNNKNNINQLLKIKSGSYDELVEVMKKDNSYRSFINKLFLIDNKKNKYYYKKMEGSSYIFNQNKFNTLTSLTLENRKLYEKIMKNPKKILEINEPPYYYEYDYPYPNLNYGKPFIQTDEYRLKRIKKMYYEIDSNKSEENWFKLIKP